MSVGGSSLRLVLLLLAGACAPGCPGEAGRETAQDRSTPGPPVVARLEGESIAAAELGTVRRDRADAAPRARLERVVARKLAAAEARRRGLAEEPGLRQELATIRREAAAREEAVLRDALFAHLRAEVEVDEAALRERYEETKGRTLRRELALRVWRLASRDEAERAAARLEAGEPLAVPEPEAHGPAPLRDLPAELVRPALELEATGDRTIRETSSGALLVELTGAERRPAPFEAVRDRVETNVRIHRAQAAWRELLQRLRAEAELEVDEAALEDDALWKTSDPTGAPSAGS